MIRRFKIRNFKSLVDFELPPTGNGLGQFACLVGLNGAGKSTVLQAFDFLGRISQGEFSQWLKNRGWSLSELPSRFHGRRQRKIWFRVEFQFSEIGNVVWEGVFDATSEHCTEESIEVESQPVLSLHRGNFGFARTTARIDSNIPVEHVSYSGSVLSLLKISDGNVHPAISAVKRYLSSLQAMDSLSPQVMRQRSRGANDIGASGERLAAYLFALPPGRRVTLQRVLKEFYPELDELKSKSMQFGWRDLAIQERWRDSVGRHFETQARHMNDGMLRLLAILAQTQLQDTTGESRCVLFDEIENGINPELTERLINTLLRARDQVIVTTHSPLILNWLPDDVARSAVILVYRNSAGHTKSVRFFDLPSAGRRLGVLGAGEAFVDVNLQALAEEAQGARVPA